MKGWGKVSTTLMNRRCLAFVAVSLAIIHDDVVE